MTRAHHSLVRARFLVFSGPRSMFHFSAIITGLPDCLPSLLTRSFIRPLRVFLFCSCVFIDHHHHLPSPVVFFSSLCCLIAVSILDSFSFCPSACHCLGVCLSFSFWSLVSFLASVCVAPAACLRVIYGMVRRCSCTLS